MCVCAHFPVSAKREMTVLTRRYCCHPMDRHSRGSYIYCVRGEKYGRDGSHFGVIRVAVSRNPSVNNSNRSSLYGRISFRSCSARRFCTRPVNDVRPFSLRDCRARPAMRIFEQWGIFCCCCCRAPREKVLHASRVAADRRYNIYVVRRKPENQSTARGLPDNNSSYFVKHQSKPRQAKCVVSDNRQPV